MQVPQINESLYARAVLPLEWRGQRAFTRTEWAKIIQFLKDNPNKTIVDYLQSATS
jgi:hypothetical protein